MLIPSTLQAHWLPTASLDPHLQLHFHFLVNRVSAFRPRGGSRRLDAPPLRPVALPRAHMAPADGSLQCTTNLATIGRQRC